MKSLNRRTGTAPRTGTRRRLLATGALLAIGVLPLSACSLFNPPLERDESVHAVFDAGQDIVKMPLDEYVYFETNNYAHTAFQIAMKQCFAEHGQNYTIQAPYSESAPRGDLGRKYGPWNVEYAQKYGFQKRDPNAAPISFNSRCPKVRGPRRKIRPRTFVSLLRRVTPFTVARYTASSKRSGSSASQTAASPLARQAPSPRKPRWLSS